MKSANQKWLVVGVLCLVAALNYCDRGAIASVFPLLRTDLKMSDLELAGVGSFFLWTYAFTSPFAGVLADRFSRSRLVLISLVGWSAVTLATGFVTSAPQLLGTRIILGFFEAMYLPAAMALIADHHTSRTRGTAIALHTAGLNIGLVAGGVGSGYLGHHYGWKFGFVALGIFGLVLGVAVHFLVRDPVVAKTRAEARAAPPQMLSSLRALSLIPSYWIIVVACMLVSVGNNIFQNWFPLYFTEKFHLSLAAAGFMGTFAIQSSAAIAVICGGYFSDRFGGQKPERRMLIEGVANLIATPFLFVFLLPDPKLFAINASVFMFSFTQKFGYSSVNPLLCDLLPPRLRSSAFGVINALNCFVGGIALLLTGYLKGMWGLGLVFAAISAFTAISGLIMLSGYFLFVKKDLARRVSAIDAEIAAEAAGTV